MYNVLHTAAVSALCNCAGTCFLHLGVIGDEKFPTAAKGLGEIIHCQERVIVNAVMPFTILIVPGPTSCLYGVTC